MRKQRTSDIYAGIALPATLIFLIASVVGNLLSYIVLDNATMQVFKTLTKDVEFCEYLSQGFKQYGTTSIEGMSEKDLDFYTRCVQSVTSRSRENFTRD